MTTNLNLAGPPAKTNGPAITVGLMLCLTALCSGVAGAQTLSSGGNYDGTILLNLTNTWTFAANAGDRIVLRGAALTTTNYFYPWLRIYNPTGALIADSGINSAALVEELALTATNSGTFTVLMSDSDYGGFGGTGAYRLYFARLPGAFVVPSGDEGGSLANGGNYDGTIQLGDLDLWSFTANAGDRIVLRGAALTTTNYFYPWLRIYNPAGVLVADSGINNAVLVEELALTATNSGTFTVLMNDSDYGAFEGTGAYRLYFAQLPDAFVVPAGDEGGSLTNGGNYDGTIQLGDLDFWSFTANTGDRIVLRGAALTTTNYFYPWLRIYNPAGVLVADSGINNAVLVEELALTATNSGTFTVLMTDSNYGDFIGTGTYRLYFAQLPGAFVVPAGDEGGSLASGGNYDGTIQLGDLDLWSFTANAGDRIVVRGAALTNTNNFEPWLRIYDPAGVLIADSGVNGTVSVEELALTATNSGTYTVLMGDSNYGDFVGTGAYRLYFAQFPGAFIVPAGDEGGSLTNGGSYDGTIQLGDLDLWSFAANAGDRIVVRGAALTTTNNFEPWLRIYNPAGVLIADSGVNGTVSVKELALTATNSGTFTVLMTDSNYGDFIGTGTYRLYVAHLPGALVVPSGDEGGSLTAGVDSLGTIQLGDLDLWRFTACRGDTITLQVNQLSTTNNFYPWLRLYGPNGVLIADSGINGFGVVAQVALTATNGGTFTVLVSDSDYGSFDGTGTYRLSSNGLSDGLKLCFPTFPGTNVALAEVGGVPGATFILFTQTNVAAAAALWTPIYTNQFDSFGVCSETNAFNRAERQRFFHLDPR